MADRPVLSLWLRRPAGPAAGALVLALLASAVAAVAADAPEDSLDFAIPDSTFLSGADSLWGLTEPVLVIGSTTSRTADPGRVTLDAVTIGARDARAAADLGPSLPATRVNVNSRGESTFMVRGASERHVRVLLDGIPLNVPWDERVDLSLVPVDAIASVTATRGVAGVLDGPNALAGTVDLTPARVPGDGRRTRLGLQIGESRYHEGRLLHLQSRGAWTWLGGLSRREQSGFLVPDGYAPPHNQTAGRQRLNSDLAQTSLFARAERRLGDEGSLRFLFAGTDGRKGVPPETHLGVDDARFWRFPVARRGLLGVALALPLDAARRWALQTAVAADLGRTEIRAYDDSTYATPVLASGIDYESDDDRAGHARVRVTRQLGEASSVAVQGVARYARHRESLALDGPELAYAQWLGSLVTEGRTGFGNGWCLRAGAGGEFAATPETGDKPARNATTAAVVHLGLERALRGGFTLHASVSRRSRFPALRELYSGALGRFVPNPDLAPERQDQIELGAVARGGAWEAGLTGFAARLDGPIEKVTLPGRQFQRRNVDDLRTLGAEAVLAWRPASAWELAAHATALSARRRVDDVFNGSVADRPAYLAWLSGSWSGPWGVRFAAEGSLTGARDSADLTDEIDGLRRLPAQTSWNVRAAWTWLDAPDPLTRAEFFVRVNNLSDNLVESQLGVPEPGRMLAVGVNAWFDAWGE
jgi:iron complex outermembrane receptor protein